MALVDPDGAARADGLVELGAWPALAARVLRARLETAGIAVLTEWSTTASGPGAMLSVGADQLDFARAVVTELDVDDEVPDTSPHAYVARIEEHLAAVAELLDELRARLDGQEREGT